MKTKLNATAQGQQAVPQDEQMTYACKQCGLELPSEAFYENKRTQCPDVYCKECRKKISRRRYENRDRACEEQAGSSYPIITQIEDKEERMRLILNALSVVRLSVERKKATLREEEEKRRENHHFVIAIK